MKKGQMGMIKILVVMILHVDSSRMAMIKFLPVSRYWLPTERVDDHWKGGIS